MSCLGMTSWPQASSPRFISKTDAFQHGLPQKKKKKKSITLKKKYFTFYKEYYWNSPVVPWLGLLALTAKGSGSVLIGELGDASW